MEHRFVKLFEVVCLLSFMTETQKMLSASEQHAEQYRTMAESMEASIKEQSAASQQYRLQMESQLSDVCAGIIALLEIFINSWRSFKILDYKLTAQINLVVVFRQRSSCARAARN